MTIGIETTSVVSVAEMARLVGLSRARFYQLLGTTFPWPVYDLITRRPLYTQEQQDICLEVRRRQVGIDGRPALFYAPRVPTHRMTDAKNNQRAEILDGVKALGLTAATAPQIGRAMEKLFPQGTDGTDRGEVLRAVFLSLRQGLAKTA